MKLDWTSFEWSKLGQVADRRAYEPLYPDAGHCHRVGSDIPAARSGGAERGERHHSWVDGHSGPSIVYVGHSSTLVRTLVDMAPMFEDATVSVKGANEDDLEDGIVGDRVERSPASAGTLHPLRIVLAKAFRNMGHKIGKAPFEDKGNYIHRPRIPSRDVFASMPNSWQQHLQIIPSPYRGLISSCPTS
jgi:hypothetical protein